MKESGREICLLGYDLNSRKNKEDGGLVEGKR